MKTDKVVASKGWVFSHHKQQDDVLITGDFNNRVDMANNGLSCLLPFDLRFGDSLLVGETPLLKLFKR